MQIGMQNMEIGNRVCVFPPSLSVSAPKLYLVVAMVLQKKRRKEELLRFYGCEAWDLPESIASIIPQIRFFYSNGLVLIRGYHRHCFVGNPVLQQWVKIPPSPNDSSRVYCLVTRVDDDGVLLSFKVVWFASLRTTSNNLSCTLSVLLYSSETGLWASKIIHCPHQITSLTDYVTVNGTNYYSNLSQPGVFVAHDFYSETDQFRVIPLPDHPNCDDRDLKRRALTTSGGFLMCMRTLAQKEETVLKVWRLNNNNDDSWQLLWKIAFPMFIGDYVPVEMHPLDSDIVYLRSEQNRHSVSCNLRTQKNIILEVAYSIYVMNFKFSVRLLNFVLPRWMESMPRPPQVEMIDTTSLLSDLTLKRKRAYIR